MSRWDEIKKSLGAIADKTATKTRELTDTASLKIKIASKEADRDTEYKILGKLTYSKLKGHKGAEAITERISETIERIDKINGELASLKAEEASRREAKAAEKVAKEVEKAKEEERAKEKAKAEEKIVMDQFNEARREADAEYEKAKNAAEEAKNA